MAIDKHSGSAATATPQLGRINPPAGYPFIVLPATDEVSAPQGTARRRLADNVVCMFGDERPPVVQQPRRAGRYPDKVALIRYRLGLKRIKPGDYCCIWGGPPDSPNRGLLVRVEAPGENWQEWVISAVGQRIKTQDGCLLDRLTICASRLRRCPAPANWQPKQP
jgi:hypothetical protein